MGHWSVYCSISRIAITSGRKVALIPLVESSYINTYDKYSPFTLPIFGEYNDYGDIENIIEDKNTKTIEDYYGCNIQDFCNFITDVRRDFNDKYSNWYKREDLEVLKKVRYMWVDVKVWNFMKSYSPDSYGRKGDIELGNYKILEKLGFNYIEESGDVRYKKHFRYKNGENTLNVKSDGEWLNYLENNQLVYKLNDLKEKGVDTSYFENKESQHVYELYDFQKRIEELGWVINIPRTYWIDIERKGKILKLSEEDREKRKIERQERLEKELNELRSKLSDKELEVYRRIILKEEDFKITLKDIYSNLLKDDDICKVLADMITVKKNMYYNSTSWEPYVLYTTPQDGELEEQKEILLNFSKICETYLK